MPVVREMDERRLAEAFRALGSPARVRMLGILAQRERYCGDLVRLFDLSQSTVSHHLKALREAGLVVAEERGVSTCYRINRSRVDEVMRHFAALVPSISSKEVTDDD